MRKNNNKFGANEVKYISGEWHDGEVVTLEVDGKIVQRKVYWHRLGYPYVLINNREYLREELPEFETLCEKQLREFKESKKNSTYSLFNPFDGI